MAEEGSHSGRERSNAGSTPRSKRIVCTSCRQSKVRCIGSERAACERCTRLEIECNRDPGFKRTSKSRKIADLEKQVQLLASVVNTRGQQGSIPTASSQSSTFGGQGSSDFAEQVPSSTIWQDSRCLQDVDSVENVPAALSSTLTNSTTPLASPEHVFVRPLAVLPQTIETLQLNTVQIDTLFQLFFEKNHPYVPFLDPFQSPETYYKSCPTLFWAIIGVASRRYRDDITLITVLSEWVMKLVWTEISKGCVKLPTVQAILLLALWPFPNFKSTNDLSVTLSSIAISASMSIGLHRPMNSHDFKQTTNAGENEIDLSSWAVANIVAQSSGAVAGHLPTAPFDWMIDQACEKGNLYTLPDSLRFKLMIQRTCHRVTQAMSTISYDPITAQSPPPGEIKSHMMSWQNDMAHFESELDSLEKANKEILSEVDVLYLAAARIHLHSFYFFDSSESDSRKAGIMKAYNSAIDMVCVLTSVDHSNEALLYLPYYHFRCLLTAACILVKVLKSSYSQEVEDFDKGRRVFNESLLAIQRSSITNNDTAAKAMKMLSCVWHSNALSNQYPPQLTIQSRFGACLTQDFIRTWQMEFGATPQAKDTSRAAFSLQGPTTQLSETFLQDDMLFSLDFLDDRAWNLGISEGPLFGGTAA